MNLNELVGKRINKILINETKDILIFYTYNELYYMTFVGDCCAHCFMAHVSGYQRYFTILDAESSEWGETSSKSDRESCEVKEQMGVKIKTDKGYLDIDTRVEHNGYYGGEVKLSTNCPLDQYSVPWCLENEKFKELQDF